MIVTKGVACSNFNFHLFCRNYEITIEKKISKSVGSEITFKFQILFSGPSVPPMTSPGCFDMTYKANSYVLFVYWRMIEDYLKNGGKFDYKINCLRNDRENCTADLVEKSMSYAKFFVVGDHNYRFKIYSVNEVGQSEDSSEVFVPKFESKLNF